MARDGVDAMWFLPSALNVKVKEFNQARVNGGSNYDSQPFREAIVGYELGSTICIMPASWSGYNYICSCG